MDLEFRRHSGVIGGDCGVNRRLFLTTGCKQQCRRNGYKSMHGAFRGQYGLF